MRPATGLAFGLVLVIVLVAGCGSTRAHEVPDREGPPPDDNTTVEVDAVEQEQVAAIAAALNHYGPAIHTCWQTAAADDYRLEGKVTLRLVLAAEGKIETVEVEGDEPNDKVLTGCLTRLWKDIEWPASFRAGDEIRLPPLSFVAPEGQHVVASAHAISYPLDKSGDSHATILLDHKNSGNSAAAMSALTMAPGFSVPLHHHLSTEVIYMLKGSAEIVDASGRRKPVVLSAGSAAYITPRAPHAFKVIGSEPAVALQIYTPGGPEQRFKGIDVGGTIMVEKTKRSQPWVLVKTHARSPTYKITNGTVNLLFDAENTPNSGASVAGMTLQPGAAVPVHRHDNASEFLFIVEGAGVLTVAGQAREVNRFDAIQIPPGIEHSFVAGAEVVKAIQFYTPSGPEQRFKSK